MLGAMFDSSSLRVAREALTGLSRRQQAISSNIANIDTPGYRRREVSFEDALRQEIVAAHGASPLATTDPRHFAATDSASDLGTTRSRDVVASRNDANNVDIDEEMMLLVETQLRYQALSQSIGTRISTLRSIIRGG